MRKTDTRINKYTYTGDNFPTRGANCNRVEMQHSERSYSFSLNCYLNTSKDVLLNISVEDFRRGKDDTVNLYVQDYGIRIKDVKFNTIANYRKRPDIKPNKTAMDSLVELISEGINEYDNRVDREKAAEYRKVEQAQTNAQGWKQKYEKEQQKYEEAVNRGLKTQMELTDELDTVYREKDNLNHQIMKREAYITEFKEKGSQALNVAIEERDQVIKALLDAGITDFEIIKTVLETKGLSAKAIADEIMSRL